MDNKELVLDLSSLSKQKIKIKDGDEMRDLYLNLSDLNIITRYKEKLEDLKKLQKDALAATSNDDKDILKLADSLKDIDTKIRDIVDYIFDSNVSEICAPYGSMYDVVNGKCRFECIIESLSTLYENNIIEETKNMENRVKKHTEKYTS